MKRIATIVLSAGLLVSSNLYADDFLYQGIRYSVLNEDAQTCSAVGFESPEQDKTLTTLEIPRGVAHNDKVYVVKEIGDEAFTMSKYLTDVVLPSTIERIGKSAFSNCSYLINVNLPQSLKEICDAAFWCCGRIEEIILPSSLQYIGTYAFYSCCGMKTLDLKSVSNVRLGQGVFAHCCALKEVTVPNGWTELPIYTFADCLELTKVDLPDTLNEIGWAAFNICEKLSDIVLPNSVTRIVDNAFLNCSGLTDITIPAEIEYIGEFAFSGCANLKSVRYSGRQLITAPQNAFSDDSYSNATLYINKEMIESAYITMPWGLFKNIEPYESSAVSKVEDNTDAINYIYSIDGKQIDGNVDQLNPGVYIIINGAKQQKIIIK